MNKQEKANLANEVENSSFDMNILNSPEMNNIHDLIIILKNKSIKQLANHPDYLTTDDTETYLKDINEINKLEQIIESLILK